MIIKEGKFLVKEEKKLEKSFLYKCVIDGIFVDVFSKNDLKISINSKIENGKEYKILTLKNVILFSSKSEFEGKDFYNKIICVGFPKKKKE